MKNNLSAKYIFLPMSVYFAYALYIADMFGAKFGALSVVLSLIPTTFYLGCFYKIQKSGVGVSRIAMSLTVIILAGLLSFIAYIVRGDIESALISGVIIHTAIAFIFGFVTLRKLIYKENALLRDKDTGNFYLMRGGKAHRLTASDMNQYNSSNIGQAIEFSSGSVTAFDSSSSAVPASYASSGFDNPDSNAGLVINPSSGMPMVGGISGVDVHGNSWGTNYNEPSSSYDPNRGY